MALDGSAEVYEPSTFRSTVPVPRLPVPGCRLPFEDLAWIHDVVGVERPLDRAHHRDGAVAGLVAQEAHLVQPDAVLARAGTTECQRAMDERVVQGLGHAPVLRAVGIDQVAEVEVAVADVAEQVVGQA